MFYTTIQKFRVQKFPFFIQKVCIRLPKRESESNIFIFLTYTIHINFLLIKEKWKKKYHGFN